MGVPIKDRACRYFGTELSSLLKFLRLIFSALVQLVGVIVIGHWCAHKVQGYFTHVPGVTKFQYVRLNLLGCQVQGKKCASWRHRQMKTRAKWDGKRGNKIT